MFHRSSAIFPQSTISVVGVVSISINNSSTGLVPAPAADHPPLHLPLLVHAPDQQVHWFPAHVTWLLSGVWVFSLSSSFCFLLLFQSFSLLLFRQNNLAFRPRATICLFLLGFFWRRRRLLDRHILLWIILGKAI